MPYPFRHFPVPSSVMDATRRRDAYFTRARAIGISKETATQILSEEFAKAQASPAMTWKDAVENASRRLAQ